MHHTLILSALIDHLIKDIVISIVRLVQILENITLHELTFGHTISDIIHHYLFKLDAFHYNRCNRCHRLLGNANIVDINTFINIGRSHHKFYRSYHLACFRQLVSNMSTPGIRFTRSID